MAGTSTTVRAGLATAATVALLAAGGCASRGEVEALRAEAADLRASVASADVRASQAEAEALRVAAEVDAAEGERLLRRAQDRDRDRAFRRRLLK